ncbi:nuclear transport factor 2 family protein [Herminiimonas sp.]|uniref:YybH family protein n=1 Tax=Herminiimonas sp. TaxID=1926289 RepID=UPI0027265AC4|nr:nuclear transport factor 2 family protein [Herminiimonas sp.]MDO8306603.1 nuclear transport factor 2 family protein [Herminiimonas sp.]
MPDNNTAVQLNKLAREPEECSRILVAALESGDIELSVALYEPTAVLFKKSGETMTGLDAIRENNAGVIALKPKFTIAFIKATLSGDGTLATNRMKAELAFTKPDGQLVKTNVDTLEVLRRQEDGSWRYIIDDPYGSMRAGMKER